MINAENNLRTKVCILGGGPAGYVAAIRSAQLSSDVVLVEKNELGGTCLNLGCIPTKSLLKTAELIESINHGNEFGINAPPHSVDINRIIARKDGVVKDLKTGLEHLLNNYKITVIRGEGVIESPNTVKVTTNAQELLIHCDKLIIASGSKPLLPSIPGINLRGVMTSDEAINLTEIPASIIVLGAGPIGLEFATLLNALGSKVTVIELQNRILPQEDSDITTALLQIMHKQGIEFKLNAEVKSIKNNNNNILAVTINKEGHDVELTAEKILLAIGRSFNITPDIEALGLKMNGKALAVNEYLETSISGVYAIGDIIGGKLMAHLAFAEGRVASENANGAKIKVNYAAIPSCVYTHPEVASVGMTEASATSENINIKIGRFDFNNNGRSLCQGHKDGFVKVIIDEKSTIILGAQILGPHASEMISEFTLAITLKAKASDLANMIHPHPTLSEAIMEACGDALNNAIHKYNKCNESSEAPLEIKNEVAFTYEIYQGKKFAFKIPKEKILFNNTGCWAYINDNVAKVGITDFIQSNFPEIVSCTLPVVGTEIKQLEKFGSIESEKTVFELISPVSGKIIAVNEAVIKFPELINKSPYEKGWMIDIELTNFASDEQHLLDATGYISTLKSEINDK